MTADDEAHDGDDQNVTALPTPPSPALEAAIAAMLPRFDVSRFLPDVQWPNLVVPVGAHAADQVAKSLSFRWLGEFEDAIEQRLKPFRSMQAAAVRASSMIRDAFDPSLFETFARFAELLREAAPPNWPDDIEESEIIALIEETGWPLVWVPRPDIVHRLVTCDAGDRDTELLASRSEILVDVRACLEEIRDPDLAYVASCVKEAACALDGDLPVASQSLSGSILTTLLGVTIGHHSLGEARSEMSKPWGERSIRLYRYGLIAITVERALQPFRPDRGDPIPDTFNRHALAHALDAVQLTERNAIAGLLIVTALVRELQTFWGPGEEEEAPT